MTTDQPDQPDHVPHLDDHTDVTAEMRRRDDARRLTADLERLTTDPPTECTCGANRADLGLRRDDDGTGILRCGTCGRPLQRAELDELNQPTTARPDPGDADLANLGRPVHRDHVIARLEADVGRLTAMLDAVTDQRDAAIEQTTAALEDVRRLTTERDASQAALEDARNERNVIRTRHSEAKRERDDVRRDVENHRSAARDLDRTLAETLRERDDARAALREIVPVLDGIARHRTLHDHPERPNLQTRSALKALDVARRALGQDTPTAEPYDPDTVQREIGRAAAEQASAILDGPPRYACTCPQSWHHPFGKHHPDECPLGTELDA